MTAIGIHRHTVTYVFECMYVYILNDFTNKLHYELLTSIGVGYQCSLSIV